MTETRRWHRTQAERSAETKAALLDATVDSLVDGGYARTSTTEIVRRAGVSRGAQVHHYPTKRDLVVAAVERLFRQHERAFAERFAALPPEDRTLPAAIDLLWSVFSGPAFPAVLELVVASRTDPELQVVVRAVGARFERSVAELFTELFPELAAVAERLAGFAFAALQGATISGYAGFGRPDEVVALLTGLAATVSPELLAELERSSDDDDAR